MSTFLEQQTELVARGFDALSTTRAKAILNDAYTEVDGAYPWPYLEDSGTGTAPLSIPTLGQIEAVTDETLDVPIELVAYRNLVDWVDDLSTTGDPEFAYVAWPSGVPTVATWPVSTNTIGVQFYRVPAALTADADRPAAPSRYHGVYLAVASRMAAVETGGDPSGWASEAERALQTMLLTLLPDQLSGRHQRMSWDGSCDS